MTTEFLRVPRLSANGMVVREENRGFRVPSASSKELEELTRTRCWLEEIAIRESIANGDSDWEERIVLAIHWLAQRTFRYRNLAEVVEYRDRHELDEHQALQDACLDRNVDKAADLLKKHYMVTSKIFIDSGRFD